MNKKYTYRWTANEDLSAANNNYSEETAAIVTDGVYDFADWLEDHGVSAEQSNNTFYVIDDEGKRTGEAYLIISVEDTDEEV